MPVPNILYLYLSMPSENAPTENLLKARRFKLSKPSSLNDPFDMIPAMSRNAPSDHVRQFLEWNAPSRGHLGPITSKMVADFKAKTDRESQKTDFDRAQLLPRTRLLCLTGRDDGVMMWSHYASRHEGFVVGFKTEVLSCLSPSCSFFEVVYEDRPLCTPLDFIHVGMNYGLAEKVFSIKSPEWAYEKEWRCLFGIGQLDGADSLSFPPAAVDNIILGSLVSAETENLLKSACEAGGILETAQLRRGRLSAQSVSIEIEPTTWRV